MEFILIIIGLIALVFIGDKFLKQSIGVDETVFLNHIEGIPGLSKNIKTLVYFYPDKIAVNNNQIIPLSRIKRTFFVSEKEVKEHQKNTLMRGVAGGLLFGPIGAIVGAISGIGTKTEQLDVHYFTIEFTDISGNDVFAIFAVNYIVDIENVRSISNKINQKLGIEEKQQQNINTPHEI